MSDDAKRADHHGATGIESLAIHAGQSPDPVHGAVAVPIYQTSTFAFSSPEQGARRFAGEEDGYIYTRLGNPTIGALEECVAALEGGIGAVAFASGMGAIAGVMQGLLRAGDHVVGTDTVYGPSRLLIEKDLARFGIASTFVDTSDLGKVEAAIRPETRILYLETPANPTLKLVDLAGAAKLAAAHGLTVVVDNTFASPVLQRPFEHGAHVVLHSTTKYLNGHADVVGGIVVCRDEETLGKVRAARSSFGANMDPHQAWLVLRGVKTLPLRVRAAQENARKLATLIEAHPAVEKVHYPGLPSHPQHGLAERQMDGPGSMISFELRGGYEAGVTLMKSVHLATLAVSLGGVETLIEHPASMTHHGLPEEELLATGITPGLVRLAVGCETYGDLERDIRQALDRLGT